MIQSTGIGVDRDTGAVTFSISSSSASSHPRPPHYTMTTDINQDQDPDDSMADMNPSTSKRPRHSRSRSLSQHPSIPGSAVSASETTRRHLSDHEEEGEEEVSPQAGPSGWQPPWPPSSSTHRPRSRASMGPGSSFAGSPTSMDDLREGSVGSETNTPMLVRDTSLRAPRSMMACTRCRRQKMKCDGPTQIPCRGCRQANQPCVFEARGRPKSISTMPTRPPPFTITPSTTARPESSTGPSVLLPAPIGSFATSTSTSNLRALPQSDSNVFAKGREPMPPPRGSSYSGSPLMSVPPQAINYPPPASYSSFQPAPLNLPSAATTPRPSSQRHSPPIHTQTPSSTDSRLRNVEHAVRSLSSLPAQVSSLQATYTNLQSMHDSLASTVSGMINVDSRTHRRQMSSTTAMPQVLSPEKRARVDNPHGVPDHLWDAFRTRAWPLAPWLIGLREAGGLAGWVVSYIGTCAMGDWSASRRRESEELSARVRAFIGRLIAEGVPWTREEIRAATVFATWQGDPTLSCTVMGVARSMDFHRIGPKRSVEDWREWVHLVIFDQLSSVPDFTAPVNPYPISAQWRERVSAAPVNANPDIRDRDVKLLAWTEMGDLLAEVHHAQSFPGRLSSPIVEQAETFERSQHARVGSTGAQSTASVVEEPSLRERERDRERARACWVGWQAKWESWAATWLNGGDPILSLHFHYAVLFSSSPMFLTSSTIWADLAQISEGYQQLERAREAAFAVVQAICSPEIGRSLPYSYHLYRPFLGLALSHIIAMTASLPHSPLVSLPHIQAVMRSAQEHIAAYVPLDPAVAVYTSPSLKRRASGVGEVPRTVTTVLGEIVESGQVVVIGKREVVGREPGRALWRRLLGR